MYRFVFVLLLVPFFASADKPDLLLITIDTLRADHLGSYGHPTIRTPNLDVLARQSLFFQNAISPAPLTLPAHTSLLTGRYPVRHGIHDNAGVVDSKELTLAEILRSNGYHTYAFIGGFPLEHRFGLNQGFDVYEDAFPRQKNRSLDFRSERSADQVVQAVLQTKISRPFFVWVHFYDPHTPYLNGGYRGEIEFVDRQIGILLRKFQRFRPVIAVAGDHGESLGEHGEWTHRIFIYDSTMRVPFWIHSPGAQPHSVKPQVRLVDFLPTILNMFKIESPPDLDGVALPAGAGKPAFVECLFPQLELGWSALAGVRTDEWKFIQAPKPELYHLATDPGEKRNVIREHKDVAQKLQREMPKSPKVERSKAPISPEMAEQLASLGYVGGPGDQRASNIDPKDRIAIWNEIEKAVDLDQIKPAESIVILERALKQDPDNPMILGFLAQKYADANRLNEAKAILQKVLARDPNQPLALYRMAALSLRLGDAAGAKKWAGTLRQIEKGNTDALLLLARADLISGDLASATKNLRAALELDPRDLELKNDLANLYLQNKQTELAQQQFEAVLQTDPNNIQALNGRAMGFFAKDDLTRSEATLNNALKIAPNDPQTKMNLALVYTRRGKKSDAITLYRQVQADPNTPSEWKEEATRRLKQLQ